ncbi:MAG: 50S ribosomal protein L33 [Patescibacteria group bacterium]
MAQVNLIKFQCSACKRFNYYSSKNKKTVERKLEFQKFCSWCKKRTLHKEAKA